MKLYYARGTCSHAPHIALRETQIPFELVRYDMKTAVLEGGGTLTQVNEKGYVPVLELDDGRRLTEVSAVLQYIADLKPESGLAPKAGTFERYQLMEWLNYLATELHKSFWPFFHAGCEGEKPNQGERLKKGLSWTQERLGNREFLMDRFTVADAYLVTLVNWVKLAGFNPDDWPGLRDYRTRLLERPSVRAAREAEGLIKRA